MKSFRIGVEEYNEDIEKGLKCNKTPISLYAIMDEPTWDRLKGIIPIPRLNTLYQQSALALSVDGQLLSTLSDEIDLVTSMIEKLFKFETRLDNWREAVPLWQVFYDMYDQIKNPITQHNLQQMYATGNKNDVSIQSIEEVIGMGLQMIPIEGNPPDIMIVRLKHLTGHLRKNYIEVVTNLKEEQGRHQALRELKANYEARLFALIVALAIGIANFISRFIYETYIL